MYKYANSTSGSYDDYIRNSHYYDVFRKLRRQNSLLMFMLKKLGSNLVIKNLK